MLGKQVKPNLDVVESKNRPKSVKILLQAQDTKELYEKYRGKPGEVVASDADQFLVQGCVVSDDWATRVEAASKVRTYSICTYVYYMNNATIPRHCTVEPCIDVSWSQVLST
jgi:hypothetical protein